MNLQEIIDLPIVLLEHYLLNESKDNIYKTLYELNKNLHKTLFVSTDKFLEIKPAFEDDKKKELINLVEKLNIWKKLSYNIETGKIYIEKFFINYVPEKISFLNVEKKIINHHIDVPFIENQISIKTSYNCCGNYHYLQRCEHDMGFAEFGGFCSFELDKARGEFISNVRKVDITFDDDLCVIV
jgi:hypothetical protein